MMSLSYSSFRFRSVSTTRMILLLFLLLDPSRAFVIPPPGSTTTTLLPTQSFLLSSTPTTTTRTPTQLQALGSLAKKAKLAHLNTKIQSVLAHEKDNTKESSPNPILQHYHLMKERMNTSRSTDLDDSSDSRMVRKGPLQQELTRRKGTLTVIAEYTQSTRFTDSGRISDVYDPLIMSACFREYLASAIAVTVDEHKPTGGTCTTQTLADMVEEQRRSQNEVPGPIHVINNDYIVDEWQVAETAALGASALVLSCQGLNQDELQHLYRAAQVFSLEVVVTVQTLEHIEMALAVVGPHGMICVQGVASNEERIQLLQQHLPQTVTAICDLGPAQDLGSLPELEDAWTLRDAGYHSVLVGEPLYKSDSEPPGRIIQSMKSKSSLKFASPRVTSGKGEGAREYLGDIMM